MTLSTPPLRSAQPSLSPPPGARRSRGPGLTALAATLLGLLAAWGAVRPASADVHVPPGYFAVTYARGLPHLTSLTFADDGSLYATQFDGDVYVLRDLDHNGAADTTILFTGGITWPLGLALHKGYVYVNSRGKVYRCRDTNGDQRADEKIVLIDNLPTGRHWNTGILFGPDGNMYVGLGSMKTLGPQPNPLCASILRFTPRGALIDQFAQGFRNPYGMAFHPSGALFCTDNGPGADSLNLCLEAPDELNWVQEHQHYGFPDCIGAAGHCADVGAECGASPCSGTECEFGGGCLDSMMPPLRELDPHSSSDGLCFGTGFPGYDSDDVFIAQFGQNEVVPGCYTDFGHKVIHLRLHQKKGQWTADPPTDFLTGLEHPLAVAVGPDHALYVSDYDGGTITRVAAITSRTGVGDDPPPGVADSPAAFSVTPNPVSTLARVELVRPTPGASVEVFDLVGRRVATAAGAATWTWDLRDRNGRRVPAGVYLVRVTAGGRSSVRKLLVVE